MFSKMFGLYLPVKKQILELLEIYHTKVRGMPSLVRFQVPEPNNCAGIIGDTHGDFISLSEAFSRLSDIRPVVVLGDIADRGNQGLMNLLYIVELSILDSSVILLRGNHESRFMSREYGFQEELTGLGMEDLYEPIVGVFSDLPYACVLNNSVLCVHGGIPKDIITLSEIEQLPRGIDDPYDPIIMQLLWNDPDEDVPNWHYSDRGPGCYTIGREVINNFLKENNLGMIVRGHEVPENGISYSFSDRVITVSSFNQPYSRGKCIIIHLGKRYRVQEISLEKKEPSENL